MAKGIAFLALNAALAWAVLALHERTLSYAPWETDSILLAMPEEANHDLVFLGTSRAYLFSRFREHHEVTEAALGRTVFNMALPQGGGIKPARFYLETYFEGGNRAGRVVYFLDPFVFHSRGANEDHKFVYFEPLRLQFLAKMIGNGYNHRQLVSYIRSKFSRAWLLQGPEPLVHHTAHMDADGQTAERVALRIETLFPEGYQPETARRYAAEFWRIVDVCRENGVPLTVAVLPTLLGPEPGHGEMLELVAEIGPEGGVYDWHGAIGDYRRYYNLDHLNLGGVELFMREFLRPALDGAEDLGRVTVGG
ncbi:MAG: hypothetical protein KF886_02400 [Candidatus Hydrogenedentes bacterium]|nr:hypothetical protein [Candidatus Hydrogenedentota bacterium]